MSLVEIGRILKQEREKHNLTLKQVADLTCISISKLEAIEQGKESEFLASVYLRGFIKSYAKVVSVDFELILDLLEFSNQDDHFDKTNTSQINRKRWKQSISLTHIVLILSICFWSVLIFWMRLEINKYDSNKEKQKIEWIKSYPHKRQKSKIIENEFETILDKQQIQILEKPKNQEKSKVLTTSKKIDIIKKRNEEEDDNESDDFDF